MTQKLVRPLVDRKIAGVCSAFANFLGIDATIIRLLFVGMILFVGGGIWIYLLSWLVIPKEEA